MNTDRERLPGRELYLRVDEIDATVQSLRAADVVFEDEPHTVHRDDESQFGPAGNEEWMAFFRDSEGNLLALVVQRVTG